MPDNSTTSCDDSLWEMVVQRHACIAEGQRRLAIDNECWLGRDVQQPPLTGYIVVAVASTDTDVRHLQV